MKPQNKNCCKHLKIKRHLVKFFACLLCTTSFAKSPARHVIAIDEQLLIAGDVASFVQSQRKILKAHYDPSKKLLGLKGKALGETVVSIIRPSQKRETHHIRVVRKSHRLLLKKVERLLEGTPELKVSWQDSSITILGELTGPFSKKNRLRKKLLALAKKGGANLEFEMSLEFQDQLFFRLEEFFDREKGELLDCKTSFSQVSCFYSEMTAPSKKQLKSFEKDLGIKLLPSRSSELVRQIRLRLEIVQVETSDATNLSLGPGSIAMNLEKLWEMRFSGAIKNGPFLMQNNQLQLQELASQELLLLVGKKAKLSLGSEIPFSSAFWQGEDGRVPPPVTWKFAGLKLEALIERNSKEFFLRHKTVLTTPSMSGGQTVLSGTSASGEIVLVPDRAQVLFHMMIDTNINSQEGIPYINQVPFIGALFGHRKKSSGHKSIICFITPKIESTWTVE